MTLRAVIGMVILSVVVGRSWTGRSFGHQDPGHRRHSCPYWRCSMRRIGTRIASIVSRMWGAGCGNTGEFL
jgi:hypothetical protein